MERYNRAWRDPRSPLTPLTPRTSHVFSFDTDNCNTERSSTGSTSRLSTGSTSRLSTGSTSRSSFSNSSRSSNSSTLRSSRTQRSFKTEDRKFKRGSPVQHPTLSPRVRSVLNRTGNMHLTEMFTQQEIDIGVLLQMTLEDLEKLGVRGAKELKMALDLIKLAKSFFGK